jgi:hypothetical protein
MQEHRSTACSRELAGYGQQGAFDDAGEAPAVRICVEEHDKDAVECDDRRDCESAFVITGDQRHATRRGQARIRSWLRALAAGRDLRQASLSRRSSMRAPSSPPPPRHWDDAPGASSVFGDGVGSSAATAADPAGLVPQLSDAAAAVSEDDGGVEACNAAGTTTGDVRSVDDDGDATDARGSDDMTTIHFDNGCVVALPELAPLTAAASYSEGRTATATVDALSSKIGHWRSEGCQLVTVSSRPPATAAFALDVDIGVCASAVIGRTRSCAKGGQRAVSAGALSSAAMDESVDPAEEAAVVRSDFVCSAACIGIRRRPRVAYSAVAVTVQSPFDVRYSFVPVDEDVHCIVELQCRLGAEHPLVVQPGSVELVPENDALAPFIKAGAYPNTDFVGAPLTTRDTVSFGFVIEHFDTKSVAALQSGAMTGYDVRFGCRYTHASVASLPKPVYNIFAGPTTRFSPRAAAPFRAKVGVAWRDVDDVQRDVPAHLRTFTVGARVPWVVRLWANTAAAEFEQRALVLSVSTSGSWLHQGYSSKRFVVGDANPSSPQSNTQSPLVSTTTGGPHADASGFDHSSLGRRRHPDVELTFCTYATETGVLEAPRVLVMNPASETGIACEVQHDLTHVEVR